MQKTSQDVLLAPLSLPKGDGTIKGMGEQLKAAGPDGLATLSLPLPISTGRGVAPSLVLTYQSSAGNGSFGLGWQCETPAIRLRTSQGVPEYNDKDSFLDPSGEVLIIARDETTGQISQSTRNTLLGFILTESYRVTRYIPRIQSDFSCLDYWQPVTLHNQQYPFWLMQSANGQVHIFGKRAHARVFNSANDQQIAEWLLEETVTTTGEHIYYQYQAEDEAGCDKNEKQQHIQTSARRYLIQINYGNITPRDSFFALDEKLPEDNEWLFHLVFDYGERSHSIYSVPDFQKKEEWNIRADCFSYFHYGFEIRTRRLCQQILMFQRLQALAGLDNPTETPFLVSRLMLNYDLSHSPTLLTSVRLVAHEEDSSPTSLPPLEFDYQRFGQNQSEWQPMPQLNGLNAQQPYQLIDLYGEGLPGVLYQNLPGACWYRSPMRGEEGEDAVVYSAMKPLPKIPSQQKRVQLLDVNGNGRWDWLVTSIEGVKGGYHTFQVEGQWTEWIPIRALPIEFFHSQSQLVDLLGAGSADLVLIGPHSVRIYAKQMEGWSRGQDVIQSDTITLPIPGADARKMVVFADLLGSGQSHLVEISAAEVRCWPNLGQGRFGVPISLIGFKPTTNSFNPNQTYLADINGSGTVDILYAHSDFFEIFLNDSGNYFRDPIRIDLPEGIRFDRTCWLQLADVQGLGIASIILTIPHRSPHHWRLDLTQHKPGLLKRVNNNLGAETTLFYRSSAQFFLDEKQKAQIKNNILISYLPFSMQLLSRIEKFDEITGNQLTTTQAYAHGVWDHQEREFRGFGRVTCQDRDKLTYSIADKKNVTYPARVINWFATGMPEVDDQLAKEFWQKDEDAFPFFAVRYSCYNNVSQTEEAIIPKDNQVFWSSRALKGQLFRSEIYGEDESEQTEIPYAITDYRIQVRVLTDFSAQLSCWTSVIETRHYQYERIKVDPRCSQHIVLKSDVYGFPIEIVEIAYPRREKPLVSPYADTLPDNLFDHSYDEQQQWLRLSLQKQTYYHIVEQDRQILGLTDKTRNDAWEFTPEKLPNKGLSLEILNASNSLINSTMHPSTFLGCTRVAYQGESEKPTIPVLIAYTESAVFDELSLKPLQVALDSTNLTQKLHSGGYIKTSPYFNDGTESDIWVARQGYTDYGSADTFYRPTSQQNTLLTGKNKFNWDKHYCVITQTQDAAGFVTQAKYDYRFLIPVEIIDINDNHSEVSLNALGQILTNRYWGWEGEKRNGYTPSVEKPFNLLPFSFDEALDLKSGIPVANCMLYNLLSWMPKIVNINANDKLLRNFREFNVITEDNFINSLAYRRWLSQTSESEQMFQTTVRSPVHILALTTDRYDSDPEQQIAQMITFSDGFGRLLQTATRQVAGEAWVRDENGSLITDANGKPASINTEDRWLISGRIEYDGKGQVIRSYQPFFLNSWNYLSDDSARKDLYAETNCYDPLGRLYQVITAKGYIRTGLQTAWFVVKEDENDTALRY